MKPNLRSVQYQKQFDRELEGIEPDFARADEFIRGTEWVLARHPELGFNIPGTTVWMVATRDLHEFPAVVIFYTFNETKVFMLSIKVVARNGDL